MSKGVQIALGACVVGLLLTWYAYTNLREATSFQYYQTLEEFLAQDSDLEGRPLRVHGYVASHSIERNLEQKQVRFRVQNDPPHAASPTGTTLEVVYLSLETPDLFKDGAEVVVEGSMQGRGPNGVFLAKNVLAKCPSKFQAKAGAAASAAATPASGSKKL